jgi:hypothetical protein
MDCEGVIDVVPIDQGPNVARAAYIGAAYACIAVSSGNPDAWRRAAANLAVVKKARLDNCLDRAVRSVLRELVDTHRADPDRKIVLAKPGPKHTACPFSIDAMDPKTGPVQGENTVTIRGMGLHDWWVESVLFSEQGLERHLWGTLEENSISITVPSAQKPGPVPVVLVMYTGERYEVPGGYTYVELRIEKIVPNTGPLQGGTKVDISGTGLAASGIESVHFGDQSASQTKSSADSKRLSVTVPKAATAGQVPVKVVMKSGDSFEVPGGYTYIVDLKIEKVEPNTGPVQGKTKVVISGSGLAASAVEKVLFGQQQAGQLSAGPDSSNSILVTVPKASEAGPVGVVVVMRTGKQYDVPGGYTYVDESGARDSGNQGEDQTPTDQDGGQGEDQTQTDQNGGQGEDQTQTDQNGGQGQDQTQTDKNGKKADTDKTQTDDSNTQGESDGPATGRNS